MKMRNIWMLALLTLALPLSAAGSEAAADPYEELTVGNTTHLNGDFFTDLWGNATSDLDVRKLIHGYNLVNWNFSEGIFQTNPTVVSGFVATKDTAGNHIYQIALYDDLFYSDGSPITAWDYAFSILLQLSPQLKELGADTSRAEYILGADAFCEGSAQVVSGVRVLSDTELTVTVDAAYLPYFYELGLLNFQPWPIGEIAPGTVMKDDGQGIYIANEDPEAKEPVFTSALLEKTILDPDTGYRTHPRVTSGPYMLNDFDGESASFSINPWFKGDADGEKPSIERLRYTHADNETMISELENGTFDLLNKVSAKDFIDEGIALTGSDPDISMSGYPRNGMSFLTFTEGSVPAGEQAVRQAIAWCLDRGAVTEGYEGNYGLEAEGYYGIGQWMYGLMNATIPYPVQEGEGEPALEDWEALNLNGISTYSGEESDSDPQEAARILEEAGWNLNEQGEAFDPAKDSVRCKLIYGTLTPLRLTLAYPAGNKVGSLLEEYLVSPLASAGIELTAKETDFAGILGDFYGYSHTGADLLYLATNFDEIFDPSENFTFDEDGNAFWGASGIADNDLYALALDMRRTEPGDVYNYCRKWVAFQERFTQTLPLISIYSNVYFDFYTSALQEYDPMKQVSWAQEILYSFYGDVPAETVTAEDAQGEELADGEVVIDD